MNRIACCFTGALVAVMAGGAAPAYAAGGQSRLDVVSARNDSANHRAMPPGSRHYRQMKRRPRLSDVASVQNRRFGEL
jgi:hypothetical protein